MANYTIEKLINDSIRVYDGMTVFYPQSAKAEAINNMSELAPKFNGCYATNNSTVCFVSDNVFVTPYTREVLRTLRNEGFSKENFYVPFSNGDYPRDEQHKWEVLRLRAREAHHRDFIDDCIAYCEEHGIRALSDETLERCLKMPATGVPVKDNNGVRNFYYPVINSGCFDATAVEVIGKFSKNNGRVVFVYRDGATYVAKGYKILDELVAAGYTRDYIFVPFSNGEEIMDYGLRERWNSITKFQ